MWPNENITYICARRNEWVCLLDTVHSTYAHCNSLEHIVLYITNRGRVQVSRDGPIFDWILGLFFITVLINFLENFLNKSGFFSLDCNVPLPFVLDWKGLQIKYSWGPRRSSNIWPFLPLYSRCQLFLGKVADFEPSSVHPSEPKSMLHASTCICMYYKRVQVKQWIGTFWTWRLFDFRFLYHILFMFIHFGRMISQVD